MAVKYQDYYAILGLPRSATQEDIKKAYRRLARKYHPDVNKSRDAEAKFKEMAEANEVLGDPENRRKYDALGSNWRMGQEFRPPPDGGQDNIHYSFNGRGPGQFGEESGFSDFFESLFSSLGRDDSAFARGAPGGQRPVRGEDHEADITISLEEAYHGANKSISLQVAEVDERGRTRRGLKQYNVNIPAGVTEGSRIRLAGQGGSSPGARKAGDLYLRIHIAPHPTLRVQGRNLEMDLLIAPWEAALGSKVSLPTLDGQATLSIPAGTQGGQRIRLRGKGFPGKGTTEAGDLIATAQIGIPTNLTAREKELFEDLAKVSKYRPRH